jgi:hypothetical protein
MDQKCTTRKSNHSTKIDCSMQQKHIRDWSFLCTSNKQTLFIIFGHFRHLLRVLWAFLPFGAKWPLKHRVGFSCPSWQQKAVRWIIFDVHPIIEIYTSFLAILDTYWGLYRHFCYSMLSTWYMVMLSTDCNVMNKGFFTWYPEHIFQFQNKDIIPCIQVLRTANSNVSSSTYSTDGINMTGSYFKVPNLKKLLSSFSDFFQTINQTHSCVIHLAKSIRKFFFLKNFPFMPSLHVPLQISSRIMSCREIIWPDMISLSWNITSVDKLWS